MRTIKFEITSPSRPIFNAEENTWEPGLIVMASTEVIIDGVDEAEEAGLDAQNIISAFMRGAGQAFDG